MEPVDEVEPSTLVAGKGDVIGQGGLDAERLDARGAEAVVACCS
jgi:hypothetical protein